MQSSHIPLKFQIPFGNSAATGTIRPIPIASQAQITPGAASLTDGFPVVTGQPLASGGIPPSLQDFNGLLNQITAWNRWQCLGGTVSYDAAFSSAVGGYPQGALLLAATPGNLWLSVVDNNTTNPDSGSSAGWIPLVTAAATVGKGVASFSIHGSYTFTVPPSIYYIYALCVGAGGGGSGGSTSATTAGGGGGAGGTAAAWIAVTPGQVIPFVVGKGGTGGSYQGFGGNGGTSTVGTILTATGGGGAGAPFGCAGGSGGGGSGGQVSLVGGPGNDGNQYTANSPGGQGGSSSQGGGGRTATGYAPSVVNGQAAGSGGGGIYASGGTSTGGQGGNGADGFVSFTY